MFLPDERVQGPDLAPLHLPIPVQQVHGNRLGMVSDFEVDFLVLFVLSVDNPHRFRIFLLLIVSWCFCSFGHDVSTLYSQRTMLAGNHEWVGPNWHG